MMRHAHRLPLVAGVACNCFVIDALRADGCSWLRWHSGAMTYGRAIALLVLYGAFVLVVLGADLWHIFTRCAACAGTWGQHDLEILPLR